MAAFPITADPSERTRIQPDSGRRSFTTQGGATRGRNSYDQTYFGLEMVDEYLTQAEVDSVWTQFDTLGDQEHTRTIDGDTYTFLYLNRPEIIEYHGNLRTLRTLARGHL